MKLINLQQSTPEWLEWRRGGITASDISCLFGNNPYKTEWQLWAEKRGLRAEDDLEGNPYVRRGKMFEFMLRERIAADRKVGLIPVCAEHDTMSQIRASLDGIDSSRRPWELKVPSPGNYQAVVKSGINSEPAQRYLPQLQHQLLVTDAAEGFLVFGDIDEEAQTPEVRDYKIFIVPADPAFQNDIRLRAEAFLQAVASGKEPSKDPKRDLYAPQCAIDAYEWQKCAAKLRPLLHQKAALKNALLEIDRAITQASTPMLKLLGQNKKGQFSGVRATHVERSGSVNWRDLVKSLGADPDDEQTVAPYRKAGTSHVQVTTLDLPE
ncbi:YqaJ viral recombinase family protein [Paracoccus sp. 1_MG-2023]|uniref:lambda-exonuclease family protein n=1 Tax=unclassified Paracoccus (in: a-proteobacteria) TaxID=2688777 RepID=UPI001C08D4CA|nr:MULTISPECIES: YqaJ viral recombinase family protein [unclassified Paracoccus (in: a-proteobacteria)]MBU2958044.1 YqaJ viral recombinase family protein [Paracoccus sp. C2R09]MDO6670316.1 YqaJ viral recombinase family protein [Paracoccus sp. 1_MG-2023]